MMKKIKLAKDAGAAEVINAKDENIYEKIMELTDGGATSVIDYVGAGDTFELASGMFGMKRGGTYVIVGLHWRSNHSSNSYDSSWCQNN